MDQDAVPIGMSTVKNNVKRWIKEKWSEEIKTDPFYSQATGGKSVSQAYQENMIL